MLGKLANGGYAISSEIDIPGEGATNFIFGRGWLLEIIELAEGEYSFFSDGREVRPASERFAVFYPTFTFVRAYVNAIKGKVRGIGSTTFDERLPKIPTLFETEWSDKLDSIDQAVEILKNARNCQSIEVNTGPSLVTLKAKRLIDENYLIYPSIARIAARLKISHEHLSRQFKKDLGLSPSAYLHQLRVAEATFRLSLGEEIIDVSQDVGYNDLSRFYKQFRKATKTSPAVCRKMLKHTN